jgi:hypothetical protein
MLTFNFMRLAFEKEGWQIPVLHFLEQPLDIKYISGGVLCVYQNSCSKPGWEKIHPYHGEEPLCMERVLVPSIQRQHFNTIEAAGL